MSGMALPGEAWHGKGAKHITQEETMATSLVRSTAAPKEVTRELISAWEQKRPALKALNDATLGKPRGFAIQKAKCVELCGSEAEFQRVADRWKRSVLWIDGITIEYEHASKSYRFIEVERHLTDRHSRVMKAAERKHRQEWQRLGVIRDADMSDHERRLRVLLMDQHASAAGRIEASREHHRLALTKPETLPRINGNGSP